MIPASISTASVYFTSVININFYCHLRAQISNVYKNKIVHMKLDIVSYEYCHGGGKTVATLVDTDKFTGVFGPHTLIDTLIERSTEIKVKECECEHREVIVTSCDNLGFVELRLLFESLEAPQILTQIPEPTWQLLYENCDGTGQDSLITIAVALGLPPGLLSTVRMITMLQIQDGAQNAEARSKQQQKSIQITVDADDFGGNIDDFSAFIDEQEADRDPAKVTYIDTSGIYHTTYHTNIQNVE